MCRWQCGAAEAWGESEGGERSPTAHQAADFAAALHLEVRLSERAVREVVGGSAAHDVAGELDPLRLLPSFLLVEALHTRDQQGQKMVSSSRAGSSASALQDQDKEAERGS